MLTTIWNFLNSKIGLLIVGFGMTTIFGTLFTEWIQEKSWEHQTQLEQQRQDFEWERTKNFELLRQDYEWERSKKFEILRRKLDEGQQSLEQISDLVNLRFFRLQKVYEALTSGTPKNVEKKWNEYSEIVEQWNIKLIINQNKLRRLVNSDFADRFNNYETDNTNIENPTSLHGKFFVTHKAVRELYLCKKSSHCTNASKLQERAGTLLKKLDYASDEFVDSVSGLFLERALELEDLKALNPANNQLKRDASR